MPGKPKRAPFADELIKGLEEGVRWFRGEIELKVTTFPDPDSSRQSDSSNLVAHRLRTEMSRATSRSIPSMKASEIQDRLRALGSPEAPAQAARFFKTGPGQYGEGDIFLGLCAAEMHRLAKEYQATPLDELAVLLQSPTHEDRMLALLIMVRQFARGGEPVRKAIYALYLANTRFVNNWDLVDASAREVVGGYLADKARKPLDRLAGSSSLWERRISIVATHYFIRIGEFADTLRIAERLLGDREDLIHKAVGWMLREVGKKDQPTLESFLKRHGRIMPRTALRYAIERFPADLRRAYLDGTACDPAGGSRKRRVTDPSSGPSRE
jgi:3-methyladenine DNA glycosylase AlkD